MKFLVIGCGSIGERHISNLVSLSAGEILAYDENPERLSFISGNYNIKTYDNIDYALKESIDAFIICVPTRFHIAYGLRGIKHNAHIFVEKPISCDMSRVDSFVNLAEEKDKKVLVGCNMRFHPALKALSKIMDDKTLGQIYSINAEFGHYLPNWRRGQDYRQCYSAQEQLGGGILLEGIHEIDYVMWLLGGVREVFAFKGKISDLEIDTEDYAKILLRNGEGVSASIHLDYLRQDKYRSCEVVGSEGTFVWQSWGKLPERIIVKVYNSQRKEWNSYIDEDFTDINLPYRNEMEHFINCIKGSEIPLVDGNTAKRALEIAMAAKESSECNKAITLRKK